MVLDERQKKIMEVLTMGITVLTDEMILNVFRECLKEGIKEKEDKTYRTFDNSLVLLVSPEHNFVEIYAKYLMVVRLEFYSNNVDWKCASFDDIVPYELADYVSAITAVYNEEKEARKGNGFHVTVEED